MIIWLSYMCSIVLHAKGSKYEVKTVGPGLGPASACTQLGTPDIPSNDLHVHLDRNDIKHDDGLIVNGFKMWLGYEEISRYFVFTGCLETMVSGSHQLAKPDLGRCYFICQSTSKYFGIDGNQCYCYKDTINVLCNKYGDCMLNNLHNLEGGICYGSAVVYTLGGNISLVCGDSSTRPCFDKDEKHLLVCSESSPDFCGTDSQDRLLTIEPSSTCTKSCDSDSGFLTEREPPWCTGQCGNFLKGSVANVIILLSDGDKNVGFRRQGYLVYNTSYDLFKLEFVENNEGSGNNIGHALCKTTETGTPDNDIKDSKDTVYVYIVIAMVVVFVIILVVIILVVIYKTRKGNTSESKSEAKSNHESVHEPTAEDAYSADRIEQTGSQYATINDAVMDRTRGAYDNTGNKQRRPGNGYDTPQFGEGVYNKLHEKPVFNTGAYSTVNETTASGEGTYNTLNEQLHAKTVDTGTYNKLDITTSSTIKSTMFNTSVNNNMSNGTPTSNTKPYETLVTSKSSNQGTYEPLRVKKTFEIGTCSSLDKYHDSGASNEEDCSNKGDYYILEKSDPKGEYYILEKPDPKGEYYILEKQDTKG